MTNIDREKFERENKVNFDEIDEQMFQIIEEQTSESERLNSKPYSYWKSVGKLLVTSPTFMISILVLIAILLLAFIVPEVMNYKNTSSTIGDPALPSWEHLFGIGMNGEDLFARVWAGTRTTLLFAFLIAAIQVVVGVVLGSIWGYFRKSDLIFIQVASIITIVPQFILLLLMVFLFNSKGYWVIVFAISLQAWVGIAQMVRVQIMLVKNTDYNTASVSLGSSSYRIINKNIMPKILPVIVQTAAFAIPTAISIEASLAYLAFDFIPAGQTSLGQILNQVMNETKWQIYPNLLIAPMGVIMIVSVVFFLAARVFADSLDPKNHR
ncbi:oligopeptide ABC transporter permease OppC [Mesoplasma coleopterae]|uniref:oligopeptide ABC transporter permease OppC n=1 Tax=Mesoplasma coleopterae TaxID=324078 RepID=UPI000D045BE6|nr:oligopeptide ABC transporter permease OppC [Mesoplasma coleopterae]AVN62808.1 peptide ABC transporter permease [Mesoplasma coleopterae]